MARELTTVDVAHHTEVIRAIIESTGMAGFECRFKRHPCGLVLMHKGGIMDAIRVALLGTGGVAAGYRRVYSQLDNVRVVATVDQNEETARQAQLDTGAERWSTDVSDALAEDVDAVVVSTPNFCHRDHALAVIAAGKHLLLQKPMARTIEECEAIVRASRQSGRIIAMYMNMLDNPVFWDLRAMVRQGCFGRIALASARMAHRGGFLWNAEHANWRRSLAQTGGGALLMLGIHYIHLLEWLLEDEIVRVQAFARNFACEKFEGDDVSAAHLEFASGATADVQAAWCVKDEHVSLLGTRGGVHYRNNNTLEIWSENGPFQGHTIQIRGDGKPEPVASITPRAWGDASNPFNQHRQFTEAVWRSMPPTVTADDGLRDMRIIEACYESARSGKVSSLTPEATPRYSPSIAGISSTTV